MESQAARPDDLTGKGRRPTRATATPASSTFAITSSRQAAPRALLETLPRFDPGRIAPSLCVLQPRDDTMHPFEAAGVPVLGIGHRETGPPLPDGRRSVGAASRPAFLVLSGPKSLVIRGTPRAVARFAHKPLLQSRDGGFGAGYDGPAPTDVDRSGRRRVIARGSGLGLRRYSLPATRIEVVYPGHDTGRFAAIPGDRPGDPCCPGPCAHGARHRLGRSPGGWRKRARI